MEKKLPFEWCWKPDAKSGAVSRRKEPQAYTDEDSENAFLLQNAGVFDSVHEPQMPGTGVEPAQP